MTPPPTVVFDLDGTLVDTAPDLTATLNRIMAAEGLRPVALDQTRRIAGNGAKALIALGFDANDQELPAERLERLFAAFIADYSARIADHSRPYPGAVDALDRLAARGWRLAVCTSKLAGLADRLLETLALRHRFAAVGGGDSFAACKPDPGHLFETIRAAGGDPANAVMIGDSATDVEMARAANIPVVAVDFGYSSVPVGELNPDAVIGDYAALDGTVATLLRARRGA